MYKNKPRAYCRKLYIKTVIGILNMQFKISKELKLIFYKTNDYHQITQK